MGNCASSEKPLKENRTARSSGSGGGAYANPVARRAVGPKSPPPTKSTQELTPAATGDAVPARDAPRATATAAPQPSPPATPVARLPHPPPALRGFSLSDLPMTASDDGTETGTMTHSGRSSVATGDCGSIGYSEDPSEPLTGRSDSLSLYTSGSPAEPRAVSLEPEPLSMSAEALQRSGINPLKHPW